MIHLYKMIIRPIFEYSSICIINAAEVHLDKIQEIQNQALRVVMNNSPRNTAVKDLHDCTGTHLIKVHLKADAKKRLEIMKKNSPIIGNILEQYETVKRIHENASTLDILNA